MIRVAALTLAVATPVVAQETIPSGQALVLWEVMWERVESGGTQAVLRFIAPGVAREGGTVGARGSADRSGLAVCDARGASVPASGCAGRFGRDHDDGSTGAARGD